MSPHSIRLSTAFVQPVQFNPSFQRPVNPFDQIHQDEMAMLQTQGFSHGPRVLLHRLKSDLSALRPLEVDLEIIVVREHVSPESLAHSRKCQRLTDKTQRIER